MALKKDYNNNFGRYEKQDLDAHEPGLQKQLKKNEKEPQEQERSIPPIKVNVVGLFCRDTKGGYTDKLDTDYEKYLQYLNRQPDPKNNKVNFDLDLPSTDIDEERKNGSTFEHIFNWIMRQMENGIFVKPDVDFVCKRSALKDILMEAIYKKGYILHATNVKNTIYFKVIYLEDYYRAFNQDNNRRGSNRRGSSHGVSNYRGGSNRGGNNEGRYGLKFEHNLLADYSTKKVDPRRPIKEFEDMNCVFHSELGGYKIMYFGEMDGLPNPDALNNLSKAKFVELKIMHKNIVNNSEVYKKKLASYWPPCVLSNCEWVTIGRYDDDGKVKEVDDVKVDEIPRMTKDVLNPDHCFTLLRSVLDYLKNNVPKDGTRTFEWRPKDVVDPHKPFDTHEFRNFIKTLNSEDEELLSATYKKKLDELPKQDE